MFCEHCGEALSENEKFCKYCKNAHEQSAQQGQTQETVDTNINSSYIGFSSRINDLAFAKYVNNTNRWSGIFSIILAFATVIGFFIYGEMSSEMENPQALFIGLGIGGMFIIIALFTIISRGKSKTWDGKVVNKKIEKKRRKKSTGDNDYYWKDFIEYSVLIQGEDRKISKICVEDDDTVYNYYQIGDRVRHHKRLNSYEKYDKSTDSIIFCNACASLNDINDDYCFRCKCPLLK